VLELAATRRACDAQFAVDPKAAWPEQHARWNKALSPGVKSGSACSMEVYTCNQKYNAWSGVGCVYCTAANAGLYYP
jgi:hypothetical protein